MSITSNLRRDKRIVWFFKNLVLPSIPIGASLLLGTTHKQAFASILAFCYTLMIVSMYLFNDYSKTTFDEDVYADTKMAITWVAIIIFVIVFVITHFQNRVIDFITNIAFWWSTAVVFLITIPIAYLFAHPLIEHSIIEHQKMMKIKMDGLEKIEDKGEKMKNELENEGKQ